MINVDDIQTVNKKLSHCRGTAWRATSAQTLSTAAQLYKKLHLKRLAIVNNSEGHWNCCYSTGHISLPISGL